MTAQEPLIRAVSRLDALVAKDPNSGFASTRLDTDQGGITVRWHGPVPAEASAEFAQDRADGIRVSVVAAQYSWQLLNTQMQKLSDTTFNLKTDSGDRIVGVGPNDDFSGLTVTLAPGTLALTQHVSELELPSATLSADALAEFPSLRTSTIPLQIVLGSAAVQFSASRQADTQPFYGGGQILGTQYSNGCSTGFAATKGSQTGIVTAAHCGWQNFTTGNNMAMGRTSNITYSYDEQFIPTSSSNSVWDGLSIASPGSTQFTKPVVATGALALNQSLCMSGAYSGAVCGNVVVGGPMNLSLYRPDGTRYTAQLWDIENTNHVAAAGEGDSGGPVFGLTNNFTADVAIAMISAGEPSTGTSCTGVQNRTCSWGVYISSVTSAAAAMGATVSTS
jgi:hypothetical protein